MSVRPSRVTQRREIILQVRPIKYAQKDLIHKINQEQFRKSLSARRRADLSHNGKSGVYNGQFTLPPVSTLHPLPRRVEEFNNFTHILISQFIEYIIHADNFTK